MKEKTEDVGLKFREYVNEFFIKHKVKESEGIAFVSASLIERLLCAGFSELHMKDFIQEILKLSVEGKRECENLHTDD